MKQKPYSVAYDARSFILGGRRVWLRSGDVHYSRIPRALWRDILEKARHLGLNTIQTYVPWNWHEPREGQFDFRGEKDLGAFLDLCGELGLYVVVRPGPYICAEWDFGGFPAWLLLKRGIRLRHYNPIYLAACDRYYQAVLPLIGARQATKGGPVIMVQLENELGGATYSTEEEDRFYLAHLRDEARRCGIKVPLITCRGWIEGALNGINAFAPSNEYAETRREHPEMPLYSTEFWSGWDDSWTKCTALMVTEEDVERESWLCLARGGAGYNYFMFHGGTHFGLTTQYMQVTSYDDHAPCNEAGGLTEKFHRCARPTRYAAWFEELLAEADAAGAEALSGLPPEVKVYHRRHPRLGSLYFLLNDQSAAAEPELALAALRLPACRIEPHAVRPLVADVPLAGKLKLAATNAIVAWRGTLGGVPTIALTGEPRDRLAIHLSAPGKIRLAAPPGAAGAAGVSISSGGGRSCAEEVLTLEVDCRRLRGVVPLRASTAAGDEACLLLVPKELERRTFAVDGKLVFGPYYVRPAGSTSACAAPRSRKSAVAEFRPGEKELVLYAPATGLRQRALAAAPALPKLPALAGWQFAEDTAEAQPDFDDSSWLGMFEPVNRNHLDGGDGYAWYRIAFHWPWEEKRIFIVGYEALAGGKTKHSFTAPEFERQRALCISGFADRILIYVNGRLEHVSPAPEWSRWTDPSLAVTIPLRPGERNTIAILTESLGHVKGHWQLRDKIGSTRGIEDEAKGLFGPVSFDWGRDYKLQGWRYRAGLGGELAGWPAGRGTWRPLARAPRAGSLRWYRTRFRLSREELAANDRPVLLRPEGLRKGLFWLNGRPMGRYWMTGIQDDYYLPKPWLKESNEIILFEETAARPTQAKLVRDAIAQVSREVEL